MSIQLVQTYKPLADLGGVLGARHPLWDPILLFLHTFSPKSTQVGGPHPPNGCTPPPPTGNPGSATANGLLMKPWRFTKLYFYGRSSQLTLLVKCQG